MKDCLLTLFFLFCCLPVSSQTRLDGYRESDINPELLHGRWPARWISYPGGGTEGYGVYHFRKTIELETLPSRFIVHVTADNRYKLYVNGIQVSLGPARGDLYNWNYETVDLTSFLRKGKNILAAVVWNYAKDKPMAQISSGHAEFLMQGNGEAETVVNTNATWVCMKDSSYAPMHNLVIGYYVAGPGERFCAADYPWGWEQIDYDDSRWYKASTGMEGAAKGACDYSGRLLVPRPIPSMEMTPVRFNSVRMAEGIRIPDNFPEKKTALVIPANSRVRLLLDQGELTTGYFSLSFSQGKKAEVLVSYMEALYEEVDSEAADPYIRYAKGNRNEVKGKKWIGYVDKIIADGGRERCFTSLWWRTWRYVGVTVKTADEPLVLENIYGIFTAYPLQKESDFLAPGRDDLSRILDIGWRTARLCANETYMDCPYYEQLQYWGDTRIQAMVSLYNVHDSRLVKNAIEQGRQSIVAEGITMSRYPSDRPQFISSFSLWWIGMGHDYWMYRGDEEYMKTLLPAYRYVLSWFERQLKPDCSLEYVPYWFFADWVNGFEAGEPIREKEGNSAFQDLMYILALDAAAGMEQAFGLPSMAAHYRDIAFSMRRTMRDKYWNEARGLFADTYGHRSFSQHVNSLAVLAGIVEGKEAAGVMERVLTDTTMIRATVYFRYYVHQALNVAGLGDRLLDNLQIWQEQMALGLTTWAESPEPSRSDCHAWSASPNIEFFRTLLGVNSAAPGFKFVHINPSLNGLKEISGRMPHPCGNISVFYKVEEKGKMVARITLPVGISGLFVWKEKTYRLESGEQILEVE